MIDEKTNKIKCYIFIFLELLIFPIICYILLESIKFNSITSFFHMYSLILSNIPRYIFVAYLILIGFALIIRSVSKNNFISNCILSVLMLCITLVSYYKYCALEQPFVPNDILLIGNLNQIKEFGFTDITSTMIISIFLLVLILFCSFYINKKIKDKVKTPIIARILLFCVGTIVIYITCISTSRYTMFNIKNENENLYSVIGANAVFMIHLGDFYTPKPEGYKEDKIKDIKNKYDKLDVDEKKENPNVILIMNESYADLTSLSNVNYSENPMKIIDKIKSDKNCISGKVISPVLGGGTSLPEFEVLTGLSSYFLEKQIYPYTSYINDDMNSIVRVFNKNNYETIGIHTNTETFYNRGNIYNFLGFSQTIFEENIMNPQYKGNFISDDEAANQIIKSFENNDGKKFIFAVTMQNHMKYLNKKYDKYDIDVNSKILTETENLELKNYTQGIVDANKMYKKIMEYLKTQQEPTILIMFGDHLPLLGDTYCSTYKKSGLADLNYYTTPYIIWANYDIEDESVSELLSISNFGLNILDMANINMPWYLKPFKKLYEEYPVINNRIIIDKDGNIVNEEKIKNNNLIDNCEILQYDILIKNKYIDIYD